ncbi:hypothetical protein BHM03_00022521 [Ensete ventricosum]|nr:hypothetical protein BHM03_00022521 [Ensete ventricosum]
MPYTLSSAQLSSPSASASTLLPQLRQHRLTLRSTWRSSELSNHQFLLVPSKRGFILTGREVVRTLGFISVVTSGVIESYGELVDAEVWGEGMVCHVVLMARVATVGLARRPDASTSDANVTDLTMVT